MKALPRFYAPDMTAESSAVTLPEDEAAHLVRVLRLGSGDEVHALNGRGLLRTARVASASTSRVTLDLGDPVPSVLESRIRITLAQALLKGDKMDDVVRDAAMAGAASIQPLITAHTEPAAVKSAARRPDRWRAIAVGSAKQSGRAVVPTIAPAAPLDELLASAPGARVAFVEPVAAGASMSADWGAPPTEAILLVGPEGGWSRQELDLFASTGTRRVTLPGPTWRADAMGLIAIVLADVMWRGRDGWGV